MTEQLTLFDNDPHAGHTSPCHWCGKPVPPPHLPGVAEVECLECNHRAAEAFLVAYAKHGRPGGKKHPGMLFPGQQQGDGEPTAAQREQLLQLLRQHGIDTQ